MLVVIVRSLRNARWSIFFVAAVYVLSAAAGMAMVHSGNGYALGTRDRIVSSAARDIISSQQNQIFSALLDAGGNFLSGALTSVLGLGVVLSFPLIAYRGWIGGIVSVDGDHASRLAHLTSGAYYLSALLFQFVPSSLVGGAGLHVGLANVRSGADRDARSLWLPREAARDALRIWLVALPLFVLASFWEFLSPWR